MLPFAKADPAKLIRAHLASNMVAPLILLYRFLALGIWAHLSICNNPVQILGLRGVFDFPLLEHLAISWPVLFLAAPKAERVAADAVNNAVVVSIIHPLSGVVAHFAVRTPFHRLVIVCERLAVPSHVLFKSELFAVLENLEKQTVRHHKVAADLLARSFQRFFGIVHHDFFEVVAPAPLTKLVLAVEAYHFFITLVGEFRVTNNAHASMILFETGAHRHLLN